MRGNLVGCFCMLENCSLLKQTTKHLLQRRTDQNIRSSISKEVAFELLTQRPQVRVPFLPKFPDIDFKPLKLQKGDAKNSKKGQLI